MAAATNTNAAQWLADRPNNTNNSAGKIMATVSNRVRSIVGCLPNRLLPILTKKRALEETKTKRLVARVYSILGRLCGGSLFGLDLLAGSTKTALAPLVGINGGIEILAVKVGPQRVSEVQLSVG